MNTKIDDKILLIVLLAIASIMVIFTTFFNIKASYDTKAEIAKEQIISDQYKNELSMLNSIKSQEDKINNIIAQYGYKIPSEPDEYKIIEFFNNLTDGAQLLGITFSPRVENSVAIEMPIKINIKSDYFTMIKILEGIVSAQRFYTVNNIDISSSATSDITYTISLSAYYINGV
jgi:Tfp pilus assembly protein PilO